MSRSCRWHGHERSLPTVAVPPVPQTRAAGLPLPGRADPLLIEYRGDGVTVVARQVDVDLGDLAPASSWHRKGIDLFAADHPSVGVGQGVVKTLHHSCAVGHEVS